MNKKHRIWILALVVLGLLLAPAAVFAQGGPAPHDGPAITFKGPIQSMSDTIPGQWQIADRDVMVTLRTRFKPDISEMQIGDIVHVVAQRTAVGLEARLIVKEPEHPRLLRGHITAMQDGLWTIDDTEVIVNDETRILGDPPDVGDLAVAQVVPTDAGLLAKVIHVKDAPPGRPVAFRGAVLAIQDGLWTIDTGEREVPVRTDDNTRIVGDPAVGDQVGVRGFLLEDDTVLANLIVKLDDLPVDTRFAGFVSEILPTPAADPPQYAWLVKAPARADEPERAWVVIVTADTDINVDPATVEVGAWVKGAGVATADATDPTSPPVVVATIVRVTRPPRVGFHGTVTIYPDPTSSTYPQGEWVIGGTTVIVDEQTRVRGDVPLDPQVGMGYGILQLDGSVRALVFAAR